MSRRRYGYFRHLRLLVIGMIRVSASIAIVGCAGVASAGDRHADLLAYDIFTASAPRPPRSVPNAAVKGDTPGPLPERGCRASLGRLFARNRFLTRRTRCFLR